MLLKTEWHRKTRNRCLRVIQKLSITLPLSIKKLRKAGDVEVVAALAQSIGRELQAAGEELQACARDLGYQ